MSARNMAKRTAAGTLALAVCLGGGALALAGAAQADANFKFDTRVAGDDRYATAVAASKAAFPTDGKTENVVLVNGFATVDGLTASYLAGVANAPILYVSDKGADDATKAEIKRLGAKNVWLVGGEAKISASVEAAIKGDGYTVSRVAGSDRYETAAKIAAKGIELSGKKPSKVFVASGDSFADALAVAPVAFAKQYPIILTEKDSTSDYSKKELGVIGTDAKILVGGEAVVSKKVQADLSIKDEQRVAGADRAVTANLVSDWAKKSEGFNPANAALVGGTNGNGADSLVAASLAGKSFTTLHFAGWDATTVYLKDHSNELTGKGFVFGGKAAVPGDQVDKAQAAAQTVAAVASYALTSANTTAGSFSYIDGAKKTVNVTVKSTDTFSIDGVAATYGAFKLALSVGDSVSIVPASTSGGASTYKLVNGNATGLVSAIGSGTVDVVEPVIGVSIGAAVTTSGGGLTYVYKIDSATVDAATFNSALSIGDTVSWSDVTSGGVTTRTIAVTSASLSGVITSTSGGITVRNAAGISLVLAAPSSTATSDTYSVDGVSKTYAQFTGAGVVTVGDKITYSKTAGIQSWALINSAPAATSGVVSVINGTTSLTYVDGPNHTTLVTLAGVSQYKVNGATATQAEFLAAATLGTAVSYQPVNPDDSASIASLAVTTGPLSGVVSTGNSTARTVNVTTANGDAIATGLAYNSATSLFASGAYAGSSLAYSVDGSTATVAQFDSAVNSIQRGSKTGTVTVSLSGGVVTWSLATAVNPNATVVSGVVSNTTKGTVVFNRPVALVSGASFASGDFTFSATTSGGAAATAPTWGSAVVNSQGQVELTYTAAATATNVLSVSLTAQGAAKLVDAAGMAAVTGTVTNSVSS